MKKIDLLEFINEEVSKVVSKYQDNSTLFIASHTNHEGDSEVVGFNSFSKYVPIEYNPKTNEVRIDLEKVNRLSSCEHKTYVFKRALNELVSILNALEDSIDRVTEVKEKITKKMVETLEDEISGEGKGKVLH